VADAETALKRLIGEAAECGEYSSVETLVRWASGLGAMCSEQQPATHPEAMAVSPEIKDQGPSATASKRKATSRTSGHSKRGKYPRFAKSGDTLVKIAWSKSSKCEYQHKSPRSVAKILADSLAHHAKDGKVVSMDKILPLKAEDGSEIPGYQVYVSLAWLRNIGVAKQIGRQGYTVRDISELSQDIKTAWGGLSEAAVG
jgi:hypothetical protein